MRNLFILFVTAVIFLVSCQKYSCKDPVLMLRPTGFDTAELNIAVMNRYTENANYQQLIYSDTLDLWHDSVDAIFNWGLEVTSGYDWELVMPVAKRSYRVNKIHFDNESGKDLQYACTNPGYYFVDGTQYGFAKTDGYSSPGTITININK